MKINIVVEKDGEGYLARIDNYQNFFAFAYSEKDAIIELKNVVEMMMDYHLEQVNDEQIIRNELIATAKKYAVQINIKGSASLIQSLIAEPIEAFDLPHVFQNG